MKRFSISTLMLLAVSLMAMGQPKLTPQAQMRVNQHKAQVERLAAARRTQGVKMTTDEARLTLVVKVAKENARETFRAMKEKGAVIHTV